MHSAEFQLATAACRRSYDPDAAVALPAGVEAARFVRLCRRHRIQGLVFEGLQAAGVDFATDALAEDAAGIARDNLRIAHECGRLRAAFDAEGISVIFLKGLALAASIYPRPFAKMGWDIDILVRPESVERAAEILAEAGYRADIAPARIGRWHARRKDSHWSTANGFHVELHTALTDNPALLRGVGPSSPRREVSLPGGIRLPTFAPAETFAYLCVHGTYSAWLRLKWLADLAALLHRAGEEEIEQLYHRAVELGAGRTPAPALILAHRHFGTAIPGKLLHALRRSRANRALVRTAEHYLSGRFELTEPTGPMLGTAGIHLSHLLFRPGLGYAAGEAIRKVTELATRDRDGRAEAGDARRR